MERTETIGLTRHETQKLMKKPLLDTCWRLISWVALAGSLLAAENAETPREQLAKSRAQWKDLKAACQGNYSYAVRFTSFAGFGHETRIVVENNQVVERRFRSWSARPVLPEPGKAPSAEGETWTERGGSLGKHPGAAPLKTLDALYEEAEKVVARPVEPFERLYLQFDPQGLLKTAFTVDTRIADDAPTKGVLIENLTLGKAKP